MSDSTAEWDIGIKRTGSATINGIVYSRVGGGYDVQDDVDAVFLKIGRIPFGFASGGYVAPEDPE